MRSTGGGRHVLLIDHSASMAVDDVDEEGTTRLELAKRPAAEQLGPARGRSLRPDRSEIMVIAFGSTPEIRTSFSDPSGMRLAAVAGVAQTDETSRIGTRHGPRATRRSSIRRIRVRWRPRLS